MHLKVLPTQKSSFERISLYKNSHFGMGMSYKYIIHTLLCSLPLTIQRHVLLPGIVTTGIYIYIP